MEYTFKPSQHIFIAKYPGMHAFNLPTLLQYDVRHHRPLIINARYLKFPLFVLNRICESFLTSTSSSSFTSMNLDAKYLVLVLLNLKSSFSKIYLKASIYSLTPLCIFLFYTMWSANGKNHNIFHWIYRVNSSISKEKRNMLVDL